MNKLNQRPSGWTVLTACVALAVIGARGRSETTSLKVVPEESQVVIDVGKTGVFGFAGHDHHVAARALSGAVEVDPSDWSRSTVSLEFRSGALRVLEADEPPADVPEVQRVMLSPRVLDAERFPTVAFRSTRVTVRSADGGSGDLRIEGGLTLHGITQPVVVPVRVTMDPSGGLEAQGTCRVKQSAYGIEPPTAAGGTVRAKDEVIVRFQVKARR